MFFIAVRDATQVLPAARDDDAFESRSYRATRLFKMKTAIL